MPWQALESFRIMTWIMQRDQLDAQQHSLR